jgi:hypothetical protein
MNRRLILFLAMVLGAFVWGMEMRAQCVCPEDAQDVTAPIQICLGGANHTVQVTYCNKIWPAPTLYSGCADLLIDMYTSIKKVCNPPTGFSDEQILNAIHCAMDPAKGNLFGIQASNFTYYSWGPLFCWVVAKPQCTRRDSNNCIVACGTANCCVIWEEYTLDGMGNIIYRVPQDTPDCPGANCPIQGNCVAVECKRPICDCP